MLGVEIGSAGLDPKNIDELTALLLSRPYRLMVQASSSIDQLMRFILQEHLSGDSSLPHVPGSAIAEVCLTCLGFLYVRTISSNFALRPSIIPLPEYA